MLRPLCFFRLMLRWEAGERNSNVRVPQGAAVCPARPQGPWSPQAVRILFTSVGLAPRVLRAIARGLPSKTSLPCRKHYFQTSLFVNKGVLTLSQKHPPTGQQARATFNLALGHFLCTMGTIGFMSSRQNHLGTHRNPLFKSVVCQKGDLDPPPHQS